MTSTPTCLEDDLFQKALYHSPSSKSPDKILRKKEFDRYYSKSVDPTLKGFRLTFYDQPIKYGGDPYYCPYGWRRYGIDVGLTPNQFSENFNEWRVAYHGTKREYLLSILQSGIRTSDNGLYLSDNEYGVYVTPSIEYAVHPRFTDVWKYKGKYIQAIIQVRLRKGVAFNVCKGTVEGGYLTNTKIDPNFENIELEWLIKRDKPCYLTRNEGIAAYGLMMRVTDVHPSELSQCKWWNDVNIGAAEGWDIKACMDVERKHVPIHKGQIIEYLLKDLLQYNGGYFPMIQQNGHYIYSLNKVDKAEGFTPVYFPEMKTVGGQPYWCPVGWRYISICPPLTPLEDQKWAIAYHGTKSDVLLQILENGFQPSAKGCFLKHTERAIYITPSIRYCSHPRYTNVLKYSGLYYQVLLRVRVKNVKGDDINPGTLDGAFPYHQRMDIRLANNQLEWVIKTNKDYVKKEDGLFVDAIMMRSLPQHPNTLEDNLWWEQAQNDMDRYNRKHNYGQYVDIDT